MLINTKYEGFYGSVEKVGEFSVRTLFYHFMGIPLWPQDSYLVEGSGFFGSNLKVREIRRHRGSVRAGYLRGLTATLAFWCAAAAVTCFFILQDPSFDGDPMPLGVSVVAFGLSGLALLLTVVSVVVFLATRGTLSAEELGKRAVYARFVGAPLDPAYLNNPWSERDGLLRILAERAEQRRVVRSFDFWKQWPELILRPEMADPESLAMGLTLTRLATAAPGEGLDPRTLEPLHAQIWQRLQQVGGV